ncbi:TlpA disulfide reductase family protein [Pedobacter hiemivivus]|uniref:AhpC/TSA family protein n=1 Tax=Pedobacter hiemivivus TaxID=2530454 RepID=A0A4R0NDQ4_9SPHI|nr:TlpA disulfide reductase family protein [Pedobacter hiemivivus]TCC98520.1 AhpC/TSA family protein [Pedobacter hiemivivus]
MKKLMLICWSILSAYSVSAQSGTYTIKGYIENLPDGKLMLMHRNPMDSKVLVPDSVEITSGVFEISGKVENNEPVIFVIQKKENGMPASPLRFFVQNGDRLTVKGVASEMDMALCTGSKYNDELNQLKAMERPEQRYLMNEFKKMAESGEQSTETPPGITAAQKLLLENRIAFIKNHPEFLASALTLALDVQNTMTDEELAALYQKLTPAVKNSQYGRMIQERFAETKKFGEGAVAIPFTKKDLNGKTVSLSDFKGKYVILDFWGSWCGPCRQNNPHMKDLYEKYKDKGVNIIGIANEKKGSLAENMKIWKEAVKEDNLPWIQILNEEGIEQFNVTELYGVNAFPTKILIGLDGKVIGRYIGGNSKNAPDPLEVKLKEIMSE